MVSRVYYSQKNSWPNLALIAIFAIFSHAAYALAPNDGTDGLATRLADNISKSGKKSVAVVDFTTLSGDVIELGRFLAEEFSVALTQKANGFDVIDRTYLKAILQEHKLASSGIIDPLTARKLGQIAGVETLVTGSITPLGDSVRMSVKVLDAATAKVIGAATGDIPKTKAIEELLGRNITPGGENRSIGSSPAPSTNSTVSAPLSKQIEDNDFIFQVKGCLRSGASVTCSGSINNKFSARRGLSLNRVEILDDVGNQYQYASWQLGAQGTQQSLEPDLRMNFYVTVKDVSNEARILNLVFEYQFTTPGQGWSNGTKLALRNLSIQQR